MGKEYDLDGRLIFNGEFLDGNKWNGKGYNEHEKLEFELEKGKGKIKK